MCLVPKEEQEGGICVEFYEKLLPVKDLGQAVKNLPVMQENQVQSLSQEDSLEEEMATHSSILAWRIPWTEEPGRARSPWGPKE